jgi:RNA polymerase sigma-70 factor (ECF subfamily)
MSNSPTTRPSLLLRIRDARDNDAWAQFVDIYAPLVYGFARRRGLQNADASDLMQEVLRAVARAAPALDYDQRKGSFRGWLFTVTRNKLRDYAESQSRHPQGSGDTREHQLLEQQPDLAEQEATRWDCEYQRRLFSWAAERVRNEFETSTWQAFWATSVEGKSPREVAKALEISVGAVYIAKSRILTRLRQVVQQIERDEAC